VLSDIPLVTAEDIDAVLAAMLRDAARCWFRRAIFSGTNIICRSRPT